LGGHRHGERGEDGAAVDVAELCETVSQGSAWVHVALHAVGHHQEMVAAVGTAVLLLVFLLVGHGDGVMVAAC